MAAVEQALESVQVLEEVCVQRITPSLLGVQTGGCRQTLGELAEMRHAARILGENAKEASRDRR